MSNQTKPGETCQQCHEKIEVGQPICRLLQAVFHAGCLITWCSTNLKRRTDLAATLRESV
jgi:hypothetical protein